jgi:hypothetical protein
MIGIRFAIRNTMFENLDLDELGDRGMIGAIACDASGTVLEATSEDLEVFGSILGYITQVADMIGEPFGMDAIEEVQMEAANTKAVCIPNEGEVIGVLCNSRANIDDVVSLISE